MIPVDELIRQRAVIKAASNLPWYFEQDEKVESYYAVRGQENPKHPHWDTALFINTDDMYSDQLSISKPNAHFIAEASHCWLKCLDEIDRLRAQGVRYEMALKKISRLDLIYGDGFHMKTIAVNALQVEEIQNDTSLDK